MASGLRPGTAGLPATAGPLAVAAIRGSRPPRGPWGLNRRADRSDETSCPKSNLAGPTGRRTAADARGKPPIPACRPPRRRLPPRGGSASARGRAAPVWPRWGAAREPPAPAWPRTATSGRPPWPARAGSSAPKACPPTAWPARAPGPHPSAMDAGESSAGLGRAHQPWTPAESSGGLLGDPRARPGRAAEPSGPTGSPNPARRVGSGPHGPTRRRRPAKAGRKAPGPAAVPHPRRVLERCVTGRR